MVWLLVGHFLVSWRRSHASSRKQQGQLRKRKETAEMSDGRESCWQFLSWRFCHMGLPLSSVSYSAPFLATRANAFPLVLADPILLILTLLSTSHHIQLLQRTQLTSRFLILFPSKAHNDSIVLVLFFSNISIEKAKDCNTK